ncbi:MAG: potassium channel family protein [Methanoregula sp.]|nr:potassium channel family protein [Methanoregula sp.]
MNSSSLQYRIYLVILVFVFLIGMLGLMAIEQFSALDALYFTVATISTVGYGDLHPATPAGKILAIIIILTGVGCFVGFVANSIEYLIAQRERKLQIRKLNMISGVFFTEVGTNLLKKFSAQDPAREEIRSVLLVSDNWSDAEFSHADEVLKNHIPRLNSRTVDLEELKEMSHPAERFSSLVARESPAGRTREFHTLIAGSLSYDGRIDHTQETDRSSLH